jgi:hypothetical protein
MSVQEFTKTLQDKVYKSWLEKLDKNIVTSAATALRSREQTAAKTSFYITENTVRDIYKTITGNNIASEELQLFMRELVKPLGSSDKELNTLVGENIVVNGQKAVFFKNIGFDTITTKLNSLLNDYPDVQEAYRDAEEQYERAELKALQSKPEYKKLPVARKRALETEIRNRAKERGTFGYYFNKGHVISIATNLTKQFRDEIRKADVLAKNQRDVLIEVLDKYIQKLESDDLATANLPNAVNQELYASYVKTSTSYLVEIQHRVGNIQSGRESIKVVEELRSVFGLTQKNLEDVVKSSPALGNALLRSEGSPSLLQLIEQDIVDSIKGISTKNRVYKQAPVLIGQKKNTITKPKSNTAKILKAKQLKAKLKNTKSKSDRDTFKSDPIVIEKSPIDLLTLINSRLHDQLKANMGSGDRRDILNYQSGRFAESVKVERLSESRMGMITAFYTYMRNPYATFSGGGRQQFPRSRDPKLLISRSIRDIAKSVVTNQLRAVNV